MSKKKVFISVLLVLSCFFFTSSWFRWNVRTLVPLRPNILLITVDAFRLQTLLSAASQLPKPPFLASLLEQSVSFSQAFTPSPQCVPAHASLLSGTLPRYHHVQFEAFFRLPEALQTLPEVLQEKGNYETVAFLASALLSKNSGLAQGFSRYDDDMTRPLREQFDQVSPNQRRAPEVVRQFELWLKNRPTTANHQKPFFAWTHFFDAHSPYEPSAPYKQQINNEYLAELYTIDQQIHTLFQHLEQEQLLSNTLIVIASTSGEGLREHQEYEHGLFLYNTTTAGMLLVHYPSLLYPKQMETAVSLLDIYPTVLDFLSIPSPNPLHGRSLCSALIQHRLPPQDIFLETRRPFYSHNWKGIEAVVGTRENKAWKYIFRGTNATTGNRYEELYSLDGHEKEDFSTNPDYASILGDFRQTLQNWHKEVVPLQVSASETQRPYDFFQERYLKQFNIFCHFPAPFPPSTEDPLVLGKLYYSIGYVRELLRGYNWEPIEPLLQKMLQADPNHAESLFLLGQVYLRKNKYEDALSLFEHVALKERLEVGLQKASILKQMQEWETAELFLKNLVERYPEEAESYKQLAYLYAENGLTQKALETFRIFFEKDTLKNPQEIIAIHSLMKKLQEQ